MHNNIVAELRPQIQQIHRCLAPLTTTQREITSRMNSVEGLAEQRYAQLQGSVNGMRQDIGALTAHMGNHNNSNTQNHGLS